MRPFLVFLVIVFGCISCKDLEKKRNSTAKIPTSIDKTYAPATYFRTADSLRLLQRYREANKQYQKLFSSQTFDLRDSLYSLNQIAYCFLMLDDHEQASPWLKEFENKLRRIDSQILRPLYFADFYSNKARSEYLKMDFESSRQNSEKAIRFFQKDETELPLKLAHIYSLSSLIHYEENLLTDSCSRFAKRSDNILNLDSELSAYTGETDLAMASMSLLDRAHERGELYARRAIIKLQQLKDKPPVTLARSWMMLGMMLKKQADGMKKKEQKVQKDKLYVEADSLCFQNAFSIIKHTKSLRIQEVLREWIILATRFENKEKYFSYLTKLDSIQSNQKILFAKKDRLKGYFYYSIKDSVKALHHYLKLVKEHSENELEVHTLDEAHFSLREIYKSRNEFDAALKYTLSRISSYNCCAENGDVYDPKFISTLKTTHTFCVLKYADIASILYKKYLHCKDEKDLSLANEYFKLLEKAYFDSMDNPDENSFLTYYSEAGYKIFPGALEAKFSSWKLNPIPEFRNEIFEYMESTKSVLLYRNLGGDVDSDHQNLVDSIRKYQGYVNEYKYKIREWELDYFDKWKNAQNSLFNYLKEIKQISGMNFKHTSMNLPSVKTIQEMLAPDEAILQYGEGTSSLICMFIDKREAKIFRVKDKESLESLLEDFKSALGSKNPKQTSVKKKYLNSAYHLYKKLIDPIDDLLSKNTELVIIPSSNLEQIPFEAFLKEPYRLGDSVKQLNELPYLIRDFKILYTPSWRIFEAKKGEVFKLNKNLKMGVWVDPSVESSFPEVLDSIQCHYPFNYESYILKKDNKKEFLENSSKYELLNLTLHGQSSNTDRIGSFISLGNDELSNLYGFELAQNSFETQLLILAVCQTASGSTESGEGTFSITRSFLEAGVKQVISTLWEVNQAETDILMQLFYRELCKEKSPSNALREAKLAYLKEVEGDEALPAYWAGIVLIK